MQAPPRGGLGFGPGCLPTKPNFPNPGWYKKKPGGFALCICSSFVRMCGSAVRMAPPPPTPSSCRLAADGARGLPEVPPGRLPLRRLPLRPPHGGPPGPRRAGDGVPGLPQRCGVRGGELPHVPYVPPRGGENSWPSLVLHFHTFATLGLSICTHSPQHTGFFFMEPVRQFILI